MLSATGKVVKEVFHIVAKKQKPPRISKPIIKNVYVLSYVSLFHSIAKLLISFNLLNKWNLLP